ncbi:dihydrolipoamide acetyltransferase family protein [Bacillus carboniphilus]|uniref:Dihydrolipoamide acetyltransferase component of pyruvate dehydrogenase complex n=1 Tax=Bacillus carboniphilus TaxID=86663 RepID=A0ABY9JYL8_9BACI|nr:dihydrolipoamide acetyltransferase family protein [Bacillus carboniphilus]WLR43868.1 dihydrolipoamide acetyltransferase family protein [Bacillus carboniphilus]
MAIEEMKMPQLGESVTEGTISKWFVAEGDHVNKYDPIAEVMTDKVNAEIPSSFTGTIKEIIAKEDETLQVGEIICKVDVEGKPENSKVEKEEQQPKETEHKENQDQSNKKRYSPAVLRLAQENEIDLEKVDGTGKGGRITRKDLQKLIDSGSIPIAQEEVIVEQKQAPEQKSLNESRPVQKATPSALVDVQVGDKEIPVSGVRQAIAQNMVRSKHEAPHAWMMVEADVTNLVNYRNQLKEPFKAKEGFSLTFFAFFVKAVAQALKEFPEINSMWAGDKIVQKKDINLSIAVATDDALFVPVIKNADEKTIKGIAREINELAQKVRAGKLSSEDMKGGTFTVNNTGSFGSVQSMGIINYPQAAILQVESIVKKPVVMEGGMFAARDMINLCLSLDHRVLDGLVCGRFLARVKEILENVSSETTSVY